MTLRFTRRFQTLSGRPGAALLAAGLIALSLAAPARPAALAEDPGVIAYIHMDDPKAIVTELDVAGAKLGQSVSALLPLFGGNFLKSPGLAGIDMAAPMTFLVTADPGAGTPGMSFVLTTTSPEAYFSTFGQSFTSTMKLDPATEKESVRTYVEEVIEFDHEGHMAAVERGETPAIEDYQTRSTNTFYVATRGKAVVVSGQKSLAERFLASDSVVPAARLVSGKVLVGARMEPLREMIRGPLAMARAAMTMQAGGAGVFVNEEEGETAPPEEEGAAEAPAPQAAAAMAQAGRMMDMFMAGLDQVERLQLGLDMQNLTLDVHVGLQAVAQSELAGMLAAAEPLDRSSLAALPKGAAIVGAGQITGMDRLMSLYFDLFGIKDEQLVADYMKFFKEWQDAATGSFSYGLIVRDGKAAGVAGVMGTRDGAKVRELVRRMASKEGGMAELTGRFMAALNLPLPEGVKPDAFQMDLKQDVAKVGGAAVDQLAMPEGVFASMLGEGGVPPEAAEMFKAMESLFGNYYYAYFPDRLLFASGPSGLDLIRDMAGGGDPGIRSALQQTLAFAPPDSSWIVHVPLGPYMDLITGMLPADQAPPQLAMVRQMLGNVVLSGYMAAKGQTARFGMRYPLGGILDMVAQTMAAESGGAAEEPALEEPAE